jgi:hypothetical protein
MLISSSAVPLLSLKYFSRQSLTWRMPPPIAGSSSMSCRIQLRCVGDPVQQAYGVLLSGAEDHEIAEYFINTAFPTEEEVGQVLASLRDSNGGLKESVLEQQLNLTTGKPRAVLKFLLLESPSPIQKIGQRYVRNPVQWQMPRERIERLGALRRHEQQRMREYIATSGCLMQFRGAPVRVTVGPEQFARPVPAK